MENQHVEWEKHGKSTCSVGTMENHHSINGKTVEKSTICNGTIHYFDWDFSIVIFVYQILPDGNGDLLVGGIPTPLKNMTSSVGISLFPTEWKNDIHVPNHQPAKIPLKSHKNPTKIPLKSHVSNQADMEFSVHLVLGSPVELAWVGGYVHNKYSWDSKEHRFRTISQGTPGISQWNTCFWNVTKRDR